MLLKLPNDVVKQSLLFLVLIEVNPVFGVVVVAIE
jgi:F0F1-type ATP synthase membrane subunit c/vacuolar-type H+-ATPase subunit K